jgi:hypothetical protein
MDHFSVGRLRDAILFGMPFKVVLPDLTALRGVTCLR